MSDLKIEQRCAIKFLVKSGEQPAEILRILQSVYKEDCLSKSRVFEWAKRFKDGRESFKDDPREGAPSTSRTNENLERLRALVFSDPRVSFRMLAAELGINKETVRHMIYGDLSMHRLCKKIVPKMTAERKELRFLICRDLLTRFEIEGNDWMRTIITGDETWVTEFVPEVIWQSQQQLENGEERLKEVSLSKTKMKCLLLVFFDIQGIVHREFVPTGQIVTAEYYIEVLERLLLNISRDRPNLASNGWILHHDNILAHTSLAVREFLAKNSVPMLPHPPYSPDLTPSDFFLFPQLKSQLKGTHSSGFEEVKEDTKNELGNISSEEYDKCFQDWVRRWRHCLELGGDYCENI